MKQSTTKKPSRSYNNNNVAQGLKGGKVFKYISLLRFMNKFSSPVSCAAVGLSRRSSALSWSHALTRLRQLSGSLTWMEMAS